MTRIQRLATTIAVLVLGVGLVVTLTYVGGRARGPLGTTLARVGTGVSALERRITRAFRGPGRAAELAWLEPYRADSDRLRDPDALLLGAYEGGLPHSLEGVVALEQALGITLPLVQVYTAWGDKPEQRFPLRVLRAIRDLGSIPVVTWEPWLTDFENAAHPHLPLRHERDRGGLAAIARGDYDFYIDAWAAEAAAFATPVVVRFAHEMNDPYRYPWGPQNNEPQAFVDAWRGVVSRFRAAGADNVVWAWSPHVAFEGYEAYWPGDDAVDWLATGALNFGTVAHWSRWWSFKETFGDRFDFLAGFDKPIMIAEFGSLAVGGDRAAWYREALGDLPARYPAVRALLFFEVDRDATVTYQALDWSIRDDSAAVAAVRQAIAGWAGDDVTLPAATGLDR